jgi:high-affinity iron transporter
MSTLINLLKTAESEYDIGIQNGTITNIAEYQDAQGFISSANELFNKTINNNKNQTIANKFSEIKVLLDKLNTAMINKEDATQISTVTNNISNTIPTILNIQPTDLAILVSTEREPSEIINNIRSLLGESINKINSGDYQNAETLVIEAYLDNFEFIEGEIVKHDESLMIDTEVLLREQLRNLIQEKTSIEDIQEIVDNINSKLNEIEKLLQ